VTVAEHRTPGELQRAAEAVGALPGVAAVDVHASDARTDGPLAEVTLAAHCDRVPPVVLRKLGAEDCGLRRVVPQGEPAHLVLEVV